MRYPCERRLLFGHDMVIPFTMAAAIVAARMNQAVPRIIGAGVTRLPNEIRTLFRPLSVTDRIAMTETPPREGVKQVLVDPDRDGQRLDNFLLGQLKGAPRSLIYRIVRAGEVRVNGKRAKPDTRLQGGDRVRIPPVRLAPVEEVSVIPTQQAERLAQRIVFEDRALLVIDKPSGIASHGGSGVRFGAIELMRYARPHDSIELAHRLDRDTSGLLVLTKKRSALLELQALMRDGGIRKRYLTLLAGRMAERHFTVDVALRKSVLQGGERMVRVNAEGKDSLSHFSVIERRGGHSYCEVAIETGRTHQIRVHASHIGHPVAGDDKYGDREVNKRLREQVGLKRLFLHAASLEFSLEQGRAPYSLSAPLAEDLLAALDRLG